MTAESGGARSECGIGALMPWNENLYMVSYLSVPNAGNGTGLYKIDPNFQVRVIFSDVGMHCESIYLW